MDTVKVSPKFQVVIPKRVREALEFKPGEELQIYILDRTIRLHRRHVGLVLGAAS